MEKSVAIFILLTTTFSLSTSFQVFCRYNIGLHWNHLGNIYNCEVTSSSLIAGPNITSVHGTHMFGRSNFDVGGIFFNTNCGQINTVPRNIRDFFPNLIAISMNSCGISTLNGDELRPYDTLIWIKISNSRTLSRIPGNLFSSTPNMIHVSFRSNQITQVGRDLLEPLQHIRSADFASNVCINFFAWSPPEIVTLIQTLRRQCPHDDDIFVTTTELMSTTTNEHGCGEGNYDQRICALEVENENLRENVANLQNDVERLTQDLNELKQIVLDLTTRPCAC